MFNLNKLIKECRDTINTKHIAEEDRENKLKENVIKSLEDGSHNIYKMMKNASREGKNTFIIWKEDCKNGLYYTDEQVIIKEFFKNSDIKITTNQRHSGFTEYYLEIEF